MINIEDKHNCCGCGACAQKCPKQCITLKQDNEGFQYPEVDTENCINCGLCGKVCPMQHPYDARVPKLTLAAINKNDKIRIDSSSGGVFTILAEKIISDGGVVFGARFDNQWQVVIDYTEDLDGLVSFRGSKYVQARIDNSYKRCEEFLKVGRKVLFSATPCQISGLYHYLGREYENLVTCDFACHGVPSPKVWKLYLDTLVDGVNRTVQDVKFRSKQDGWRLFDFEVTYKEDDNHITISSIHNSNLYMRSFIRNLIIRPSCYQCNVKQNSSSSDITIADFWGVENIIPQIDDDKGVSLVLVHSEKGKQALDFTKISYSEVLYSEAIKYNSAIVKSVSIHKNRKKFFKKIDKSNNIEYLMSSCLNISLRHRIKEILLLPMSLFNKRGG